MSSIPDDPIEEKSPDTRPPKPTTLPVHPESIPLAMQELSQWVFWRYTWIEKKQIWDKPPLQSHSGNFADSSKPKTWSGFEAALNAYHFEGSHADGIGFMFDKDHQHVGGDLDDCRDPETGVIEPWAQAIIDQVNTYTEISTSGTGVHFIAQGQLPGRGLNVRYTVDGQQRHVELYDSSRYFATTGHHLSGTPKTIEPRQEAATHLYHYLREQQAGSKRKAEASQQHNGASPHLDDDVILQKALGARNGRKLAALWAGEINGYPSQSEADLALCRDLAFWTQDPEQIDRLFRRSGLMRGKWDEHPQYAEWTISKAIETTPEHYQGVSAASSNGQPHVADEEEPPYHIAEVRDDEPEKSPPSHQPSPKVFFRKKTFIPKRLGDYLLTQHSIKYAAGLLWVYRSGVYSSEGERILAATAQQLLGEERRQNRIEEALRYIEVAAYAEMPPPDLRFINLLNGRLEWATDTLHPHTPDVFTVIQLPVRFDQTATCPTFDYYLDTTLDADVILLVEEVIGHLLIPDTRYEKAVMLTGDGGNGKSVFIDMLTALLGPQHVSNVALQDLEENRFRVAELFGKLGNFFADLDPRALKSSSLFKTLVTGDEIEAERKFRDPFKFRNVARLVFSANKLPDSSDRTHAFYRRWYVIPFTRTFTGDNRDPDLRAKLVCELPGILNRALTGLKRLSAQKAFTVPQAVKEALNNYERQNDTLAAFLEEAVDMGPKLSVTKQRFYQRYCRWCDLYRLRPISQKELSPRLYKLVPDLDEARLDVRGVRGNKGPWRWIGIQPIDDGSEADEG